MLRIPRANIYSHFYHYFIWCEQSQFTLRVSYEWTLLVFVCGEQWCVRACETSRRSCPYLSSSTRSFGHDSCSPSHKCVAFEQKRREVKFHLLLFSSSSCLRLQSIQYIRRFAMCLARYSVAATNDVLPHVSVCVHRLNARKKKEVTTTKSTSMQHGVSVPANAPSIRLMYHAERPTSAIKYFSQLRETMRCSRQTTGNPMQTVRRSGEYRTAENITSDAQDASLHLFHSLLARVPVMLIHSRQNLKTKFTHLYAPNLPLPCHFIQCTRLPASTRDHRPISAL